MNNKHRIYSNLPRDDYKRVVVTFSLGGAVHTEEVEWTENGWSVDIPAAMIGKECEVNARFYQI